MKLLLCFIIICGLCSQKAEWINYALKLSGESEKNRQKAINSLRTIDDLEIVLKKALKGEDKYLALDVITALNLKIFLRDLLELSINDEEGFFYLTINTLIDEKNKFLIAKTYIERLENRNLSSVVRIIILETLGYWGVILDKKILTNILEASFEERMAILTYIRYLSYKYKKRDYVELLKRTIKMEPYQLRVKSLYLISELKLPFITKEICLEEKNIEVKETCLKILKDLKS